MPACRACVASICPPHLEQDNSPSRGQTTVSLHPLLANPQKQVRDWGRGTSPKLPSHAPRVGPLIFLLDISLTA